LNDLARSVAIRHDVGEQRAQRSKTISGAVRESAHATTVANGCWSAAVSARRAALGLLLLSLLVTNRSLPAFNRLRASSGVTTGLVGSDAIATLLTATAIKKHLEAFRFMTQTNK
jgi:hypothetical protein